MSRKWHHLRHSAQLKRMAPFLRFLTAAPSEFSIMQNDWGDWGKQRLEVDQGSGALIMNPQKRRNSSANGDIVSPSVLGKLPFSGTLLQQVQLGHKSRPPYPSELSILGLSLHIKHVVSAFVSF